MSARHASLHELGTCLGVRDAYDLIEIISVDAHNQRVLNSQD